jgi:DNA polymerase-3 subunit delta
MSAKRDFRVAILYGDDRYSIEEAISKIAAPILEEAAAGTAEMNILRLDGSKASFGEIESALMVISFFSAGHRLVILDKFNKNNKIKDKPFQKKMLTLLGNIPPTTQLVIPFDDEWGGNKKGWDIYRKSLFLRKWAETTGKEITVVKEYQLPHQRAMGKWIEDHARQLGGKFSPGAATALASLIGNDTALAHQEVLKILTYLDFSRAAEEMEVQELVSYGGQADIFELVDTLALGQGRKAQQLLHLLLEEQSPIEIFSMIVRQFRLLIIARDILDRGGNRQMIISKGSLHPYVAQKLEAQASRFTLVQLEEIYHQLLEIDEAGKSGGMPLEISMDVLLFDLSNQHR